MNVALYHSDYLSLSVYLSFLLPLGRFSSSINPYFTLPRFPPPDSFPSPIPPYLLLPLLPPFHPSLPIPSLPSIPSPPSINPSPIAISLTFPPLHHLYFHPSLPFLLSTSFHPSPTINPDLPVPHSHSIPPSGFPSISSPSSSPLLPTFTCLPLPLPSPPFQPLFFHPSSSPHPSLPPLYFNPSFPPFLHLTFSFITFPLHPSIPTYSPSNHPSLSSYFIPPSSSSSSSSTTHQLLLHSPSSLV